MVATECADGLFCFVGLLKDFEYLCCTVGWHFHRSSLRRSYHTNLAVLWAHYSSTVFWPFRGLDIGVNLQKSSIQSRHQYHRDLSLSSLYSDSASQSSKWLCCTLHDRLDEQPCRQTQPPYFAFS